MNIEGQNKELFLEFVDFVKSKPKDMEINNGLGWSECAVGEFCVHKNVMDKWDMVPDSFLNGLLGTWGKSPLFHIMNIGTTCPDTYGELSELLEQYI